MQRYAGSVPVEEPDGPQCSPTNEYRNLCSLGELPPLTKDPLSPARGSNVSQSSSSQDFPPAPAGMFTESFTSMTLPDLKFLVGSNPDFSQLQTSVGNAQNLSGSSDLLKEDVVQQGTRLKIRGDTERKAEQNRRAQARFRQRKKDRMAEMEVQLAELAAKLRDTMREKQSYQEKANILQQMMEQKDKRIESLRSQKKENMASEELVDTFWDMVVELKRWKHGLPYAREAVAEMINNMLTWRSTDIMFIRQEVNRQLAEALQRGGDQPNTPANLWINDLVTAYNKMVHRSGENPLAFRTFLSLQLPDQSGRSKDSSFWRHVLAEGQLNSEQKALLVAAQKKLMVKMQELMDRRDAAGLKYRDSSGRVSTHPHILGNMTEAKEVLDLHAHVLKEEQTAVFNFRTTVGLVLEPVQQAKLMVASHPFALDTLAICSAIGSQEEEPISTCSAFMSQLPCNSAFQSLATDNPAMEQ